MTSSVRPAAQWQTAAHPGPPALRGNLTVALAQASQAPGAGGAWRRGWVLTALGRYGEALTELAAGGDVDTPYGASAAVTRASLLRQVGLHARAEKEDTAVAAAAPVGSEVAAAAMIGLVADEVGGQGRHDELDRRLSAAGAAVGLTGSARQRIRMAWVAGEAAMVAGEFGLAEGRFDAAADAAKVMGAARHHAKSLGFLSAAGAALGRHAQARGAATAALDLATAIGARPLEWAVHLVLADLGDDPGAHHRQAAAALGASVRSLPDELRDEALLRPPANWLLGVDQ